MTTATRKVTQKIVHILARYALKNNGILTGVVVYLVLSSKGNEQYTTTLVNGKATGCTCPAQKPCYHMTQLEKIEQERIRKAQAEEELKHPFRLYHNLLNNWLYIERQGQPDSLGFPQWLPVLDSNADKVNFALCEREEAETLLADLLDAARDAEVIRVQRVEYSAVKYRIEVIDEEYEQWKRENGLDTPMSRERYDAMFDPNGWELL